MNSKEAVSLTARCGILRPRQNVCPPIHLPSHERERMKAYFIPVRLFISEVLWSWRKAAIIRRAPIRATDSAVFYYQLSLWFQMGWWRISHKWNFLSAEFVACFVTRLGEKKKENISIPASSVRVAGLELLLLWRGAFLTFFSWCRSLNDHIKYEGALRLHWKPLDIWKERWKHFFCFGYLTSGLNAGDCCWWGRRGVIMDCI